MPKKNGCSNIKTIEQVRKATLADVKKKNGCAGEGKKVIHLVERL
jgi:hypothetical protein